MNRIISYSIALIAFPLCILAQPKQPETPKTKAEKKAEKKERVDKLIKQEEEGALIYQKQSIFGIKLNNDGYAVFFEKGLLKTAEKANLFSLEIGERKSNREQKISSVDAQGFSFGSSYVFGKQNNFYFIKLGVGQSYLIGGKGNKNGVAVSLIYGGGLSLGLLKPYNLKVTENGRDTTIRYLNNNSHTDSLFLSSANIKGSAGLFKGFGNLKFKPGLFLKAALRFDYGKYNETVSAIEGGVQAEYYAGKMPIMIAQAKDKNLFVNVYIALEFGRRK